MLSKAMNRPANRSRRSSWAWIQRLIVLLMLMVMPGPADVIQEVVAFATGIECCNGKCDDPSGQCCPKTCSHCRCCVHFNAVVPVATELPRVFATRQVTYGRGTVYVHLIGYRAPPFRPPTYYTMV